MLWLSYAHNIFIKHKCAHIHTDYTLLCPPLFPLLLSRFIYLLLLFFLLNCVFLPIRGFDSAEFFWNFGGGGGHCFFQPGLGPAQNCVLQMCVCVCVCVVVCALHFFCALTVLCALKLTLFLSHCRLNVIVRVCVCLCVCVCVCVRV